MMTAMTFRRFQASARNVDNVNTITGSESFDEHGNLMTIPGIAYDGDAIIERDGDKLLLRIYNSEWSTDTHTREQLEAILYAWCLSEFGEDFGASKGVVRFICNLQEVKGMEAFAMAMLANAAEPNSDVCHMNDIADAWMCALDADGGGDDGAADIYHAARPFIRGE